MIRKDKDNGNKYHLVGVFVISLLCIISYSNTLDSPFVFDDPRHINENAHIRLTNLDLTKLYDAAFKSPLSNRPVANVSFALNYYFGEYDPTGYHIFNIMVHLVSGILVYFLALIVLKQLSDIRLQQATQSVDSSIAQSLNASITLMSLFTALIFIAHPLQTQSVTYIVQRMNSMAAMFYLLSLLLYIHGRLTQVKWKRWALLSACFLSWGLAIGSKEIAATLPFVIFLYEWYFFQDLSIAWLKRNIKYLLVPIAILCLFVFIYLGSHPFDWISVVYARRDFTMWERVLTQFRVVIFYISLLLYPLPSRLNVLHRFTTSHSLFDPITTLVSLLAIASLIGLGIYQARRQRLISFCILWFLVHLVMESSVYPLEMIFEHRLYLPMFGFALIVIYALFCFLSSKRLLAVMISVIIVLCLGTATYLRNGIWQDDMTLWSDVLSKNPESYRAHLNLGTTLMRQGSLNDAVSHYYKALQIKPHHVKIHNNLGIALREMGKLDEAISHYHTALQIKRRYAEAHNNLGLALRDKGKLDDAISHHKKAVRIEPYSAPAHYNLGLALGEKGESDKALSHYIQALRLNPNLGDAHFDLAVALTRQGRFKEAITHLSKALQIKPDDAAAHNNLGQALVQQGKLDEAIVHFSRAIEIRADYAEAHNNLALALRKKGKLEEAISHYEAALRIEPDLAVVHNNLGNALAQQGRLDQAIERFSKALEIKADYAEAHNNLGIALAKQGSLKEAIAHFSEALRLKPDYEKARHNLQLAIGEAAENNPRQE